MKKRFIPVFTALALTGLVACGSSDNGLVKNGVAYKDGDAAKTSETVRQSVEGKVKKVTEKLSMKATTTAKYGDTKESAKENVSASLAYDFEQGTVDGTYTDSMTSSGKTQKNTAKFKAKQQADGSFQFSENNAADTFDETAVAAMYLDASTSIYAWNFTMDLESLMGTVSAAGSAALAGTDLTSLAGAFSELATNLVIDGDATTGSFEVGLKEEYKLNLDLSSMLEGLEDSETTSMISLLGLTELPMTIYKMKYVYKDGLLRSEVAGVKLKMDMLGMVMEMKADSTTTYSYEMKK